MFTDGSVDNQSGIGYGAFLFLYDLENSLQDAKDKVQLKRFEKTSSTKIELQILLHALKILKGSFEKIGMCPIFHVHIPSFKVDHV